MVEAFEYVQHAIDSSSIHTLDIETNGLQPYVQCTYMLNIVWCLVHRYDTMTMVESNL